jgi:hypothetical protein
MPIPAGHGHGNEHALEGHGQPILYYFEGYLEFRMNLLKARLVVCERGGVTMLEDRHVGRLACCQ